MSSAGDRVLEVARAEIGITEYPPGSNNVKYWDWYGGNYGSWCACFVSWVDEHAGYPCCSIDSSKGFILVSNGTIHSYLEYEWESSQSLEPGDTVLYSWYPWSYVDGIPTINSGEWAGWVAGDHTGIFSHWINRDTGQFAAVEGNTSVSSWDNGGAVMERSDRFASQVCGWWRIPAIDGSSGALPIPIEDDDDEMMRYIVRAEDGSAYAVDGIKAYPISSAYTVTVLQAIGVLMTRAQMDAKGFTVDVDGNSIRTSLEIQQITESVPDKQ